MAKGIIYKITNKINNKSYVGCTINNIKKRFEEHVCRCKTNVNSKFYNSMRKYGFENFSIEILEICDINVIYDKEREYILKYDTFKNGLNSTLGGEGCLGYVHSNEIRKKISKSLKDGNSHKGKSYEELYGKNAEHQKNKRKEKVKTYWKEINELDKLKRINTLRSVVRSKSKYSEQLIKEIKEKLKVKKVTEVSKEYPEVNANYLYSIKSGKRWNNI
jgi:group I intron endonuclease